MMLKSKESHYSDEADDQQCQGSLLVLQRQSAATQREEKSLIDDCQQADQQSHQINMISLIKNLQHDQEE